MKFLRQWRHKQVSSGKTGFLCKLKNSVSIKLVKNFQKKKKLSVSL